MQILIVTLTFIVMIATGETKYLKDWRLWINIILIPVYYYAIKKYKKF